MITLSKEIYTGITKWNGNHYFAGDIAKGYLVKGNVNNGTFINHQWEDLFGNTWGDTVEIEADSLELVEAEVTIDTGIGRFNKAMYEKER
jgi:hypothetical protein